jgi:glutamyl-tRNA reductase
LQKRAREIVDAEVQRALSKLPDLDEKQRAVVEQLGRAVMQKLLHRPMVAVRKASGSTEGGFDGPALAEALRTLFELDLPDPATDPANVSEPEAVPRPEPS